MITMIITMKVEKYGAKRFKAALRNVVHNFKHDFTNGNKIEIYCETIKLIN